MPEEIVKSIVRFCLQFKVFLVVCLIEGVCWLLLFGSNPLLDHFGLTSVAHNWRGLCSLIFVGVSVLIIWCAVEVFIRQPLDNWEDRGRVQDCIRNVTRDQAIILVQIAESANHWASFNPSDPAVKSLVVEGVLQALLSPDLKSAFGPTALAAPYLERRSLKITGGKI
jgi:hypothetical protein